MLHVLTDCQVTNCPNTFWIACDILLCDDHAMKNHDNYILPFCAKCDIKGWGCKMFVSELQLIKSKDAVAIQIQWLQF